MARRAIVTKVRKPKSKIVRVGKKGIALASSGNTLITDFKPRDPDVLRYGPEPSFSDGQPIAEKRKNIIGDAYSWYSRFCTHKDAKQFLINYLEKNKVAKDTINLVRKSPDNRMVTTAGWVARCNMRGLELEQREVEYIQACVDKLIAYTKAGVKDDEPETSDGEDAVQKPKRVVNIQQIMREKADEALGEVELIFDEFVAANYPKDFDVNKRVIGSLSSRNVLPQHIATAIKRYNNLLTEYLEVQLGKDEQLNEAYSNLGKMQVRYAINVIEQIIAELNGYISLKQATKKVRARKPVPVEKTVARLKYLKTFKDDSLKLDLTSVSPTKLHQSTEAWVYDTKRRKLHHYVADDYSKCLMVKGNTVVGFDKKLSGVKTLRKPGEQIKEIMGSKPAARKYFDNIRAVQAVPNGRFSTTMVILKAF